MKSVTVAILDNLIDRHPVLAACKKDMTLTFGLLVSCFGRGGKLMVCGNGGSAADSEHIVGELMKGFKLQRPIGAGERERLASMFGEDGNYLAARLQRALPAIALTGHCALATAFANDVAADMAFAQQVYGYARPGDALLCLSTSGSSVNVVRAAMVAKALGLPAIALTGAEGGRLVAFCDAAIKVPAKETYQVQEYHLPVYHALFAMLENEFFG
jgi:D-sedoheptulose 7-phosphate isomerase